MNYFKRRKIPARRLKKWSLAKKMKIRKLHEPFSRGVQKRGNPTMTKSTIMARRKGDPQHYVEGNNICAHVFWPAQPSPDLFAPKLTLRCTKNTPDAATPTLHAFIK